MPTPKLDKLIRDIDDGDYKVPPFQRGYVWKQEQVIELLDSVRSDYPIGTCLLWKTSKQLRSRRNIGGFLLPDKTPEYPIHYILDGQQRLSTLYAVLGANTTVDPSDPKYRIEADLFDIWFDLDTQKFLPKARLDATHSNLKLKGMFNAVEFFAQVNKFSPEKQKIATELLSTFNNFEIPMIETDKREIQEVGIIFERINSTGTKLSTLDLMVAWTWDDSFHLKEQMDELAETLEEKSFGDLPDKIILQCISGILVKQTSTKAILGLPSADVKAKFPVLTESLVRTIDFLSTQLNMGSTDFLPHAQQIVALSTFFANKPAATAPEAKVIKQWFWKTSFSRRYSESTDDKMDADIAFMAKVAAGTAADANEYSHTVTPQLLIDQKFSKSNNYARALLLLLAQKVPLDLVTHTRIDINRALSQYNRKEYHHIFPQAFLKERKVPVEKISSLSNFCMLSADSNRKISKKAPSAYVPEYIPDMQYKPVLESNLMPLNKDIYNTDNYDEFLRKRAELIVQTVDQLTV